jgi:hypothetical protein
MALIRVALQDETGQSIAEGVDLPQDCLPPIEDRRFPFLRYIDPYGDTIFNRLQMDPILDELRLLKAITQDRGKASLLERTEGLAKRCQSETHLYLAFIGD